MGMTAKQWELVKDLYQTALECSPAQRASFLEQNERDEMVRAEVHRLLSELAGNGVAILMISSELPEVLRVGDRILVMREGRLVGEYARADASEEKIMSAATGQLQEQAQ